MYTTTTKGYKLPSTGDRGTWWQNIIDNFVRVNDHTHNGIDSQLLTPPSVVKDVEDVAATAWSATTGGTYRQLLTCPASHEFPKVNVLFFVDGGSEDGVQLHLSIEPQSATTFYVYINDNTLNLKAVYA